ncbi:MAG TPA: tRNA pseudouridine(55) synthase TruB, partial [Candidatus Cloacimonadota bacterium]|nr:tRNA pseudouridine(55) synthase TruB [Candidatus Cloacimonadota bacterium]
KRAYSLARKQIEVTMPSRSIRIYEFAILEFQYPQLKYTCTVSKGTYIRSLTETIGEMLGTIATTTSLRRTRIGNHSIEEGIPLHNLDNGNWKNNLIPIEKILDKFEHLSLNPEQGKAFCNGMQIGMENSVKEGKYLILIQGNLIGIGEIRNSVLSPKKVIG